MLTLLAAPAAGLMDAQSNEAVNEVVNALRVPVLVFYSGTHPALTGFKQTWSKAEIDRVVSASNARMAAGHRTKFYKDHLDPARQMYTLSDTLGYFEGEFWAKDIESPEDVPFEPMLEALKGSRGIYGTVVLSDQQAIAQYHGKLLKEVSVGIDLSSDGIAGGFPWAIFEVSGLGIQALPGAALFGKQVLGGLTLRECMTEEQLAQLRWEVRDLLEIFNKVLREIEHADDATLNGRTRDELRQQAMDDLAALMQQKIDQMSAVEEQNMDSIEVSTAGYTPDQVQALQTHIAAFTPVVEHPEVIRLRAEVDGMRHSQTVTARYSKQRMKGDRLVAEGKLPPGAHKAMFEIPDETLVETFGAIAQRDPVEYALDLVERFAVPMQFGSVLGGLPVPGRPGAALSESEVDAQAADIMAAKSSMVY